MDLKETGCEAVVLIHLTLNRVQLKSLVNTEDATALVFLKRRGYLDQLSDY